MADLSTISYLITDNGTWTIPVTAGRYYSFGAAGTNWDSGSLAIGWTDTAGNTVDFPDSPLTGNNGFVFVAPTNTVTLTMSSVVGAAADVLISIATIS